MSIYDEHFKIEADRQQYWVEYYAKMGIEYKPSKDLKYDRIVYDLTLDEDDVITNPAICFLLSEFEIAKIMEFIRLFCVRTTRRKD